MESSNLGQRHSLNFLGSLAGAGLLAALPVGALAQSMGSDDPVGKPFALWIFLVPIAGVMAALTAYLAKAAVEKPGGR